MTRLLLCDDCVGFWRRLEGPQTWPDGTVETTTIVSGKVREVRAVRRCDDCGVTLGPGTPAHAATVSTPRTPYRPWEDDLLEVAS